MPEPYNFSWVESDWLAGMGRPCSQEEIRWLREQGIEVVVTLTEEKLPRAWTDSEGLLVVHEPIRDMTPPEPDQFERIISAIDRARSSNMKVSIHCAAGMGRTGTALAAYFVHRGMGSTEAIEKIRTLRPGSVETTEQMDSIHDFARKSRKVAE
ncbi:MAG: protein phosphatase [Gemmataceae bacterium]|nr:protein phosphatase [Gemmataceae bacterium]